MGDRSDATIVDFWFDPVCQYSWTASRWLREVRQRWPVRVRYHAMSLDLLNEHRTDVAAAYRRSVEGPRVPARVATAAATRFGDGPSKASPPPSGRSSSTAGGDPARPRTTRRPARRRPPPVCPVTSRTPWTATHSTRPGAAAMTPRLALAGGEVGPPVTALPGVRFCGPVLKVIARRGRPTRLRRRATTRRLPAVLRAQAHLSTPPGLHPKENPSWPR